MAIEEPEYSLIKQEDHFELRAYKPMIIAETQVSGDLSEASNAGFRRIADYIFGNNTPTSDPANTGSEKISMTAPVAIEKESPSSKIAMTAPVGIEASDSENNTGFGAESISEQSQWRVSFVMPATYTMNTLPKPNNDKVVLKPIPAEDRAVIRFSGFTGDKKVADKTAELLAWMESQELVVSGQPQLARYNPPWTLPFLRRNEILITYEKN